MNRAIPLPLVAAAAVVAVSFWSLKPIFIALIGDRTGYAEVFILAGTISTIVSSIVAGVMWRTTLKLVKAKEFAKGLMHSLISGAFLAVWYYCFYRALFGSQKVDATVIAFSWPLIAVVATRIFAPEHGKRLTGAQWALIATAYFGAIAVGISGVTRTGFLAGWELIFAFAAAFASGLYLPFAINGIARFNDVLGNRVLASFYTVSFANAASLLLVSLALWSTDQTLLFYAVDGWVILICALIGIGTYLLAEVTWTWAFAEYKSLTLSALVYLSPAFSVILLFVFFDEPIAAISAFGLILILFANLTLHGSYQSTNALILAMIGTLFVALISLFIAPTEIPHLTDMLYFMSGLFAILAGFILSRVSSRRAQEIDQRTSIVRSIVDQVDLNDKRAVEHADSVLRGIIDVEFISDLGSKDVKASNIRYLIKHSPHPHNIQREQLLAFDTWLNIHRDRLSFAEKSALWLTGSVSILLLLAVRGNDPLSTVGLYAFAAGCLLVIFAISDYERNSFQGFRHQMLRLQNGFQEIGKSSYLPKSLIDSNESLALFENTTVRYCNERSEVCEQVVRKKRSAFRVMYSGISMLLIGALLTLPIFMANDPRQNAVLSLRPEVFADAGWSLGGDDTEDLTIGVFDWGSSQVIGEIIKQTLNSEFGLTAAIEQTTVDEIFQNLAIEGGSFDIHTDFWAENQPEYLQRYVKTEGSVQLNSKPYPGRQGVYLSAADAQQLTITDIADLQRKEVISAFDADGDGRGEIWIGAPGWRSTRAMEDLMELYGLNEKWEALQFSDTIMKAKLRQFSNSKQPIIFYGYEPDWIHSTFDLHALSLSPVGGNCPKVLGIVPHKNGCAFKDAPVHIAYATRLQTSHPYVAQFLKKMSFQTEEINFWLAALANGDQTPSLVAQTWLENNSDAIALWKQSGRNN